MHIRELLDGSLRPAPRGYSGARPDVVRLTRDLSPRCVLDVGCGAGGSAVLLRERHSGVSTTGVEPDAELAQLARQTMQSVVEGSIEDPRVLAQVQDLGPFDLILCADVLEHLVEPAGMLSRLVSMLAPGGHIVLSLPNIRHYSTFVSLGIAGTWPQRDRGIHDRTHLRFFARKDMVRLIRGAGLEIVRERRNPRLVESLSWTMVPARLLDFWPFRPFLTFQYLFLLRPVRTA